jgi:TonB family protein
MRISRMIAGLLRRGGIAASIILIHYCCIRGWESLSANTADQAKPETEAITATLIPAAPQPPNAVPLPAIDGERPAVDMSISTKVVFTDPDAGKVPGVLSPMSVPHPVASDEEGRSLFARRAGLKPGEARTVILRVQVLADGSIGEVTVATSSGFAAADRLAMAYVRTVRWIPGSINRQAANMRVRYVVMFNG